MPRIGFIALIVVVVVLGTGASGGPLAAEVAPARPPSAAAISRTLVPFLHALKRGDLHRMQARMTPGLYAQYRTLFEQNREYPAFLRKFYRGAKLSAGTLTIGQEDAKAEIPISWSDGRTTTAHVTLTRDADGRWKVNRLFD